MTIEIPLQEASVEIWAGKYQLKDGVTHNPLDKDVDGTFDRVSEVLSEIEPKNKAKWKKEFKEAMDQGGCYPGGRIMANAGAGQHKPATSTINCTVSSTIEDSFTGDKTATGIFDSLRESAITLKYGCGIGYEFSSLRPKGSFVYGAGAATSGPLPFMDIFDKSCFTVSSAGGRRGAQMATFDISHPDVIDFIKAKREDGRFRQFNCSILITKKFMDAVANNDSIWNFQWKGENYGEPIQVKDLWDTVMKSTYDFAEPGFILIDRVNYMNNLWFCENIRATNPCGEQPLPPYGSCLLGSVNLTKYVDDAFTDSAKFDWTKFRKYVKIFARMLDNVVEINGLPLPQQQEEIFNKRRHGMGYLGLGSALAMMGMKYGSEEAVKFTERVSRELAVENFRAGVELAKEKGEAPVLTKTFTVTEEMVSKNSNLKKAVEAGEVKVGAEVTGRYLLTLSHYFDAWKDDQYAAEVYQLLQQHGTRFTHATSIAPTGTMAFSFGNNCSNGIEPSFSHRYFRNVIKPGKKTKEQVPVYSYEFLAYRHFQQQRLDPTMQEIVGEDELLNNLPECFADTSSLTPEQHIDMQAAAQKWIDSSISKTINVPTDFPYEKFKDIYLYGYKMGLKGVTTYRHNPERFSGVLVREEDIKSDKYEFTLEDGSKVVVAGNQKIEYDGETHVAANLFEALKDGYYAKF